MNRILLLLLLTLTFGAGTAYAQSRLIRGRVVDETGLGFPSAGITVRGTQTGTTTDLDGNFQLNVPDGSTTLTVQALGYGSQDVAISDNMVIRLQRASRELAGAVVTAQAIRREKRELGYSATTLNNDELNGANQSSALSSLAGKVAGANVTSATGGPGGSTRVVLRGEKSVSGNNNALIVVDGVIVNNGNRLQGRNGLSEIDFGNRGNDVNPEDIESVTVLRGPAAAALYGSAGANGAIMITTKSGRNARKGPGKTEITYQSTYTLQNVLKYPEFQNTYGQGNIYGGIPDDRRENFSWGLPFDGQLRPWGQEVNGQTLVKPYVALKDNIKEFYRTGRTWENNVSLGGASDNNSYYLSLNTLNNDGITPNTFYNKYSIRVNATSQLSNKFYTSVNVNYININQRVEQQGQRFGDVLGNLLQTPRDIPVGETRDLNSPFHGYGFADAAGVQRYGYYNAYALNPFWVAANYDNRNRTDRVLGNAIIGFKKGSWEVFDRVGGDFSADRTLNKIPKYSYQPFDPYYDGNDQISAGGLYEANVNTQVFTNDLIAQYRRDLSESVNLDWLVGHNITMNRITALTADINPESNGLVIADYYNFKNASGPVQTDNALSQTRSVGLYSSLKLSYQRSLYLELTARNDWSSTLFKDRRSFFYPSANLSWVFTETFNNDFTDRVLTFGKLKANYASVGAGAQTAYQNNNAGYSRGSIGTAFGRVELPFNGVPGYTFGDILGNPDLRPERTNSQEAGVELGFFRDRISLDLTFYRNMSIDQILTIPVSSTTGYSAKVVNIGDISNRGVEMSLRVTPVKVRNGLTWDLFGTYTRNKSNVDRLAPGIDQVTFPGTSAAVIVTATVGRPYGAIYANDFVRDSLGRTIVDSATGLPSVGTERVYQGTFQPRFQASWGTTLRWKGWALNVLFDTKQGGVFYSSTKDLLGFVGTSKETENRDAQIWPNSVYLNSNGDYVRNTTQKYLAYDYFTTAGAKPDGVDIVDASYVKLREASLYYTLPAGLLKRSPFGSAQLGIFGNNLAIWTSDENKYVDPEVNTQGASNTQGYEFRARPSLRNYGISLRVSF